MKLGQDRYSARFLVLLSLLLASIVPLVPLILVAQSGEWPVTHEYNRYFLLMEEFRQTFDQGFIYPRWLSNLNGGYGYPTFVFYQPGFFFFTLPFSYLFDSPMLAFCVSLYLMVFMGASGMYLLCRALSNRAMGFVCTLLYLLTPYLYVNLYVRGDLSEFMAMLLCPWPLAFLVALKKDLDGGRPAGKTILGISISLAAIIYAHPAPALVFFTAFLLLCFFLSWDGVILNKPFLMRAVIACTLGLTLSCAYWLPVFQMERYVNLEGATKGYFQAHRHSVYPHQLVSRQWLFGESVPDSPKDTMSFQLGLCHMAFALFGAAVSWKLKFFRIAFLLYSGLILFMTPIAGPVWGSVKILQKIQFPWRILSVSATYQALLFVGAYPMIRRWSRPAGTGVCMGIVLVTLLWHSNQFTTNPLTFQASDDVRQYNTEKFRHKMRFAGMNEFSPLTAMKATPPREHPALGPSQLIRFGTKRARAAIEYFPNSTRFRIHGKIVNAESVDIVINQLYFKGWKVFVDGRLTPEAVLERDLTEDGRMRVSFPVKGTHTIQAFYSGPPGSMFRTLITGVSIVLFGGFWYWDKTKIGSVSAS